MHKILILLFLIISIPILSQSVKLGDSPSEYMWKYVGSPDFTGYANYGMNFTLGSDGTSYVAYGIANSYSTALPAVMKFDGTQWVFVGSHPFGSGYGEYYSLAISPSGEPYLAFDECSQYSCDASCMKYDGSDWVYLNSPGDLFGGETTDISMVFSPAGEPWVAFSPHFSDSAKVSVKKYDGTQWSYVGPSGFSEPNASNDCLAFNKSGEAFVAYKSGNNVTSPVEVRKFNGTNWVTIGTPSVPGVGYLSLAMDTSGQPWVAFDDYTVSYRLSVMRFNGSQWVYVGPPGINSTQIGATIIAFSPSGEPWVSYSGPFLTNQRVSAKRFNGTQWIYVGDSAISPPNSDLANLVFRSDGEPYVGFYHIGCNVIRYDSLYTGIKPNKAQTMLLYPNPASSFLTINLNNQGILGDILKIFDMRGTQILEKSVSGNIINLEVSSFPVGIYCVEITGQESYFYRKFCKTQ